jgi:hypothetical protein
LDHPDPVEIALAKALGDAAAAGRFDVVAQLASELEARRRARTANVVSYYEESDEPEGGRGLGARCRNGYRSWRGARTGR